jgi:Tol biopolymer transport system component
LDYSIYAAPFDLDALEITGGSVPIEEGVGIYSISNEGTMIYLPGIANDVAGLTLLWVDREGNEEPITDIQSPWVSIKMSPDGTGIALAFDHRGNQDVRIWDIVHENMTRLTFDETEEYTPLWTPDSKQIVFTSENDESYEICWKAADGTGEIERLASVPDGEVWPWSWSGDGNILLLTKLLLPSQQADIEILSMEGDRARKPLLNNDEYVEADPQVSPDGNFIAYASNESGNLFEVFVRGFPDINRGKWQVSQNGGHSPLWSPDGKELFYRNGDETFVVPIELEPAFKRGKPEVLFRGTYHSTRLSGVISTSWDITPDGKRFIMARRPQPTENESSEEELRKINIVLNWFEELKERVPTD